VKRVDPSDPANLAKLPRWAQQEIERLTRNEAHYAAKLRAGPEDSDTFADPYSDSARRPLGRGTTIEFVLGQDRFGRDKRINVRTEAQHDGTVVLDVSGSNSRIAVLPRASNSIEIVHRDE
jgi:hypothetical protein